MTVLDAAQRAVWQRSGYLILRQRLDAAELRRLTPWTEELQTWPETPGKWMKYFETGPSGLRMLCRVENFVPYHDGLDELLSGRESGALLSELMKEDAVLFKEKVNFKLPGGSGFAAHQDAPAFRTYGQTYHITMMISVDPSTIENGCLEVADGHVDHTLLPQADDGTIRNDIAAGLRWDPLPTLAGDAIVFHSYLPHRSGANRTGSPRRAYYVTYNRRAEGDRRADYFRDKRAAFPPECEREPGVDYTARAGNYNLGNPIR